jgi:hypothetical protein|nr:MAG TPA: protein of unknown function DUF4120 [Caudoviricetes sp.]
MNTIFGEFGVLDILVVLNYFEVKKTNKMLRKLQKLQTYAQIFGDDELQEILEELKEWKNMSTK